MASVAPATDPRRVVALDVVRGLAVLGMFTAHLGDARPGTPSGWLVVADGRSAATFALLAGVSAALLDGGPTPLAGAPHRHAVGRVLARAALLLPLGVVLVALATPVDVILVNYAVLFGAVSVALTWPRWALLAGAGAALVVGPVIWALAQRSLGPVVTGSPVLDPLVGRHYPAVVWIAYLLVGVALGRADLLGRRTAPLLLGGGVALAASAYGVGTAVHDALPADATLARTLTSVDAHANTAPEVLGNVGVTLALLGLVLLVARAAAGRRLLLPLAATGALALTAYTAQLVAIAALGADVVRDPSNGRLLVVVAVTVTATTAWWVTLGRGPLERAFHALSRALADALVGDDLSRTRPDVRAPS